MGKARTKAKAAAKGKAKAAAKGKASARVAHSRTANQAPSPFGRKGQGRRQGGRQGGEGKATTEAAVRRQPSARGGL